MCSPTPIRLPVKISLLVYLYFNQTPEGAQQQELHCRCTPLRAPSGTVSQRVGPQRLIRRGPLIIVVVSTPRHGYFSQVFTLSFRFRLLVGHNKLVLEHIRELMWQIAN